MIASLVFFFLLAAAAADNTTTAAAATALPHVPNTALPLWLLTANMFTLQQTLWAHQAAWLYWQVRACALPVRDACRRPSPPSTGVGRTALQAAPDPARSVKAVEASRPGWKRDGHRPDRLRPTASSRRRGRVRRRARSLAASGRGRGQDRRAGARRRAEGGRPRTGAGAAQEGGQEEGGSGEEAAVKAGAGRVGGGRAAGQGRQGFGSAGGGGYGGGHCERAGHCARGLASGSCSSRTGISVRSPTLVVRPCSAE